jgi:hypothetical protein
LTLFLTSTEAVFLTTRSAVRMRLVGANPEPEVQGVDPLPGRYDVDLGRIGGWPRAPGAARVRPTFSPGGLGYQIESDLADGILTADGFTVTEPRAAAAFDIASGDRITGINGYPPAGGAFASVLLIQRDRDRNTLEIELERDGSRLRRTIVVR